MRIMIVTTDFLPNVSGIATLSYEQAIGLAKLGHEVRVVTITESALTLPSELPITVMYSSNTQRPILRLWRFLQILKVSISEWRPDYIWCSNYRGFGLPVMVTANKYGIPFGLYVHGTELVTENRSYLRHRIFSKVAAAATVIAANSRHTANLLKKHFGYESKVITPGVHPPPPESPDFIADVAKVRNGWLASRPSPVPDSERLIFFSTSRISRQKGIHKVLESLSQLSPEFRARFLYVVGGFGTDEAQFKRLATDLDIADRVIFNGKARREDLPKLVHAADIYLQPSQPEGDFLEGFGISFLEAQVMGVPCIASDWCGIPEAVKRNITALLVEPGSTAAITEAIKQVVNDTQWRESASIAAKEWAQENNWYLHAQKLEAAIRKTSS